MFHPKLYIFSKKNFNFFSINFFLWILVDNVDGDAGGDGDGQLLDPKLTETIANIYKDLGKI